MRTPLKFKCTLGGVGLTPVYPIVGSKDMNCTPTMSIIDCSDLESCDPGNG